MKPDNILIGMAHLAHGLVLVVTLGNVFTGLPLAAVLRAARKQSRRSKGIADIQKDK